MEQDIYGNPLGTLYPGSEGCPEGMMCIPENEFHMQLEQAGMEYDETTREIQPTGDAEAIIDFTQTLLTSNPSFNIKTEIIIFGLACLSISNNTCLNECHSVSPISPFRLE